MERGTPPEHRRRRPPSPHWGGRLALLLALGTLAAGCARAPVREVEARAAGKRVQGVSVEAENFDFVPNRIRAKAGAELKLRVRNTSFIGHNLTVLLPDGRVAGSVDIDSGKSAELSVRLPRAGSYVIYCDKFLHRTFGMEGVIEVR
ncbi:MAG: cupredoxin domain-containing protein [Nitrospinota bacterium]